MTGRFLTAWRRMARIWSPVSLFWLCACLPAFADMPAQAVCEAAGRVAEAQGALPANLLQAIGLVESGRPDPVTGQILPWPWTVNADGTGHYFASEQEAAAFARLALASGARDVDIGCFQVSLEQHGQAFASLDQGFDPGVNAEVAARFLARLKLRTGTWAAAIADYHSGLAELGLPYQRRVLAAWQRMGGPAAELAPGYPWPGSGMIDPALIDPGVIIEAPAARLVRVITRGEESEAPRPGLPRVITP